MTAGAKYTKIVEWSDQDRCFIGSCPELFYGGCHGNDEQEVFDHLCRIVEEIIELSKRRDNQNVIILPEEDVDESEWLRAASENPVFTFLEDPEEDIYSINDGKPINDKK